MGVPAWQAFYTVSAIQTPRKCVECGKTFNMTATEADWFYQVKGIGLCCGLKCLRRLEKRGHRRKPEPNIPQVAKEIVRACYRQALDAEETARRTGLTADTIMTLYERFDDEGDAS